MTHRDLLGIPASLLLAYGTFFGSFVVLGAADLLTSGTGAPTEEYLVYYDPDGMVEGEGFDEAPDDAVPGEPEAVPDAEPAPEDALEPVQGERVPPPEITVDVPIPEPPEQHPEEVTEVQPPEDVPVPDVEPTPDQPRKPGSPSSSAKPDGQTTEAPPKAGTPGTDPTKVKDRGTAGAPTNKSSGCEEPHPQIKKLSDSHWLIQKSLVEYYTSSLAVFNTLGYSHKYEGEDGQKGWQIGGFGCKGPLWKAGLRSRDVIQSVNGKKTYNVAQIIALWAFSKKKGDFEVQILRKGAVLKLVYSVEDK